ncbi:hypothetical protein LJC31_02240 [Synergistaceae bacterium OttesenSCG-928-I11]|nr:hypothetical protein [Synergistaceae bacterium OttesenSCG-928-I11]
MSTTIGIVGPERSIVKIRDAIEERVMYVQPVLLPYDRFPEAVDILRERQGSLDCVLFSGSTPYRYASHYLQPTCPWEYLPQSQLSLVCSLMQAVYIKGWDISRASFDSYEEALIYSAYREAGYSREDVELYFAAFNLLDEDYIEMLCQYHRQMYETKRASCCVTGIEHVRSYLLERRIPCIIIQNAMEVIVQQVNKLRLDLQAKMADDAKLATVAIEIAYRAKHSAYSQSTLQVFYNKSGVSEQVYMYAQKLGAAVIESPGERFYLFTTKSAIQNDTDNFRRFDLLGRIMARDIVQNAFVGVGLGNDANQSQRNAETARRAARQSGVDCLYVVQENGSMIGPITSGAGEGSRMVDESLHRISERTGIGARTLSRLDGILRQYQVMNTTARELADLYGVNIRSMSRILLKLEQEGYVTVVGKEATAKQGRPGRIIRVNLHLG